MKSLLPLILVLLTLTACGEKSLIVKEVPIGEVIAAYHANDMAIGVLDREFREANLFSPDEINILKANQIYIRKLIQGIEQQQQQGNLEYVKLKFFYEESRNAYFQMEKILDRHIDDYNDVLQALYWQTRISVNLLVTSVNAILVQAEQEAKDADMQALYNRIGEYVQMLQPFLGTLPI